MISDLEQQARRRRERMARAIAAAAAEADRLGLQDVVAILREAEDVARRGTPDRRGMH